MKTTIMIFLTLLIIPATVSQAQLDPGANSIGIYFDLDATVNCLDTYFSVATCHILITSPSESSGIAGMEGYFDIPSSVFFLGLDCPGFIIPPPWPDFQIFFLEPLPPTPIVWICDFHIFVATFDPAMFYIYDPAYYAGDDPELIVPLNPSTGYDEFGDPNPVAAINGDCPVPSEATTWGCLKSLYQ